MSSPTRIGTVPLTALHSLWAVGKLDAVVPLFKDLSDALAYLSDSDKSAGA